MDRLLSVNNDVDDFFLCMASGDGYDGLNVLVYDTESGNPAYAYDTCCPISVYISLLTN